MAAGFEVVTTPTPTPPMALHYDTTRQDVGDFLPAKAVEYWLAVREDRLTARRLGVVTSSAEVRAAGFAEVPDTLALICYLNRDTMLKAINHAIDAGASADALGPEARQVAEAELTVSLLEIERREAAAVWACKAAGLPPEFRSAISALAILQCRLVAVPPQAGAQVQSTSSSGSACVETRTDL